MGTLQLATFFEQESFGSQGLSTSLDRWLSLPITWPRLSPGTMGEPGLGLTGKDAYIDVSVFCKEAIEVAVSHVACIDDPSFLFPCLFVVYLFGNP